VKKAFSFNNIIIISLQAFKDEVLTVGNFALFGLLDVLLSLCGVQQKKGALV